MRDFSQNTTQPQVPPPAQCTADGPETAALVALRAGRRLFAWLPIPLLLALIVGLWVADLRTAYESRTLMVLLNVFFTWLASLCICFLTVRGFLGSGQPGLLMFGCGSLLWGVTSLAAAVIVDRVNPTVTVHNVGVLGAALCHLVGSLWHGRLPRPGRWLLAGYAGALMTAALIVWAATAGLTPVFFVQGQGGTPIRQVALLLATGLFAWVAWQMIYRFRRQSGAFYYWYGLGLALVATGLIGVMLLSVQGGILGWTNRLTQYLGNAYLFIAALMAARETGKWRFSLTAVDGALQEYWFTGDRRLASIVESSSDAILSKTLDGIIRTWNAGAERIYGYTAEEVVGRSVSLLVPPGQPDEVPQILERIARENESLTARPCACGRTASRFPSL